MRNEVPFAVWSRERQRRIESVLETMLADASLDAPERLADAMRYTVLGGGKRVRALLAYAAGETAGADVAIVDGCAAAVELIHAYSLVHDDLPCMDDDTLRRGKPSCHVAFGEATALLAGDALQSLAFAALARSGATDAAALCATLADAAGAAGMAGGQSVDVDATGRSLTLDELSAMHRMKTGAMIRASVRLGAGCDGRMTDADTQALDAYGRSIGVAFQIIDDMLDVKGTASSLGKTPGKDAANAKPTYVSLLGFEGADARVAQLRADAKRALDPFGERGRRLVELADWICERDY